MAKRTIEVNDVLPDCVSSAIERVRNTLVAHIKAYKPETLPCLSNDLDRSGAVFEIVDGCVPFVTADIEAAWFLHGDDLQKAYEDAGVGDNPRDNNGMAAIYYYIEQQVSRWYSENAAEIFAKHASRSKP